MERHSEQEYMSERRSHSYDESFLYYDAQAPRQRQGAASRKPPLHHQTNTREGPPLVSRDDIALGTTVVSPLGRIRAHYVEQQRMLQQQQRHYTRPLVPTVSPHEADADSVPFDQKQDDQYRSHPHLSPPDRSVRPFDEESMSQGMGELSPPRPVIQSRVHGPHRAHADPTANHNQHHHHQQQQQQPHTPPRGYSDQNITSRFRIPPVRVSKPALDAGVEEDDDDSPHDEQNHHDPEPPALFRTMQNGDGSTVDDEPYLSPASGKTSVDVHPPESPMHGRMRGVDDAYEEFGNGSINTKGNTTEEDDSLFDFGEKRRQELQQQLILRQQQEQQQQNRRAKKASSSRSAKEADETSEDDCQPCTSLTVRTQEAWKRKSTRERKAKVENTHVSFTTNDPSVHRYSEYETEHSTVAGNSLNSEYTKSMESEVEDAIKDIFMIGSGTGNNPGRRKLKYRPDMRRQLRWEKTHPDEDTLESEEEAASKEVASPKTKSARGKKKNENSNESRALIRSIEEKKTSEGDALLGAWNLVESSLQAMGVAFGIDAGGDDETAMTYDDSRQEDDSETLDTDQDKGSPVRQRGGRRSSRAKASIDESYGSSASEGGTGTMTGQSATSSMEEKSSLPSRSSDLMDYWSGGLLGEPGDKGPARSMSQPQPKSKKSTKIPKKSFDKVTPIKIISKAPENQNGSIEPVVPPPKKSTAQPPTTEGRAEKGLPSLDKDLRLIELAIQSARSYHKLRGVVYDESDVDIVTDIKFIVVDLTLPLGLIFQENEAGCWVTKVLTDGSAIKKSIQVGDQLAAIDGKSAIGLNVDDIASAIRQKKTRPFELTFLRYVGPLRPVAGVVEEEGYEIRARLTAAEEDHKARGRRQRSFRHKQGGDDSPGREKRRFRFFGRKK